LVEQAPHRDGELSGRGSDETTTHAVTRLAAIVTTLELTDVVDRGGGSVQSRTDHFAEGLAEE
jgi:hypothetical protein